MTITRKFLFRLLLLFFSIAGFLFSVGGEATPLVRLYVREASLQVLGREVKTVRIEQDNGIEGYYPQESEGFHVEVINQLKVPTSIHWHGLILPAAMDGVPFVSQEPIPPNGRM